MKNEALSDAVSMIDDRFIAEAQEPFQKRCSSPLKIKICAAAACIAAAFLLIPRGQSADVLIYGENPAKKPVTVRLVENENSARAISIEFADIPVTVSAAGKTEVSVSSGELFFNENRTPAENPLILEKSAEILWSIPLMDKEQKSTLIVKTAKQSQILTLSFDKGSGSWIINGQ